MRSHRFTTPVVPGVTLHTIEWGREHARPLVLLHGGGANVHWWDHLAPTLAEHFRVFALDFRGHGDSDYPQSRETGAFHRDLEALLDHTGIREPILVGHSLGGHVAIHHAAHVGARALVAIEVSRGAGNRERRRMRLALAARRSYRTRAEAIERFRFLPESPDVPESRRLAIAAHSVREEPDGRFAFKFDARWFGVPPTPPPPLDRISCPTLVVRGEKSSLLSAEAAAALAAEIPDARVVEISGGGHNVHLEQPEAVLEALASFLTPIP